MDELERKAILAERQRRLRASRTPEDRAQRRREADARYRERHTAERAAYNARYYQVKRASTGAWVERG